MDYKLRITLLVSSLVLVNSQSILAMDGAGTFETPNAKSIRELGHDLGFDITRTDYANFDELDTAISNKIIPDMSIASKKDYPALEKRVHAELYETVKNAANEGDFMTIVRDLVSDKYHRIRKAMDDGDVEEAEKIQRISTKEDPALGVEGLDPEASLASTTHEEEGNIVDVPPVVIGVPVTPMRTLPKQRLAFPDEAPPKGTPNTKNLVDILGGVDFSTTRFRNINNFARAVSAKVSVEVTLPQLIANITDEVYPDVQDIMNRELLYQAVNDLVSEKYLDMQKAEAAKDPERVQRIRENNEHDSSTKNTSNLSDNKEGLQWTVSLLGIIALLYGANYYFSNRPAQAA